MLAALQKTVETRTTAVVDNGMKPCDLANFFPEQDQKEWVDKICKYLQETVAVQGLSTWTFADVLQMREYTTRDEHSFVRGSSFVCPTIVLQWLKGTDIFMTGRQLGDRYTIATKMAKARFVVFADAVMQELAAIWRRHSDIPIAIKFEDYKDHHEHMTWRFDFDWTKAEAPEVRLARDNWERRQRKALLAYAAYHTALHNDNTVASESPAKKLKH